MDKLKSTWIRGQQLVKRKLGASQVTEDGNYKEIHSHFEQQEKIAANFKKRVNQIVENFHALSTTLHFFAEDCRDVYKGAPSEELSKKFMALAEDVEKNCVIPFQERCKEGIMGPVEEFHSQFGPLKSLHDTRKNKILEYEYHRDRVAKLAEKPNSKNPTELPKAKEQLQKAKEEFEEADQNAKNSFTEIVERRVDVYDPSLHKLIDNLNEYFEEMYSTFKSLKAVADQHHISASESSSMRSSNQLYPDTSVDIGDSIASGGVTGGSISTKSTISSTPSPSIPLEFEGEWFFLDDKVQQQGPITFFQLRDKFKKGELGPSSHVFGADMANWTQINAVPKLMSTLSK